MIRLQVEAQLGPLEDIFDEFNMEPVASASIGQVCLHETPFFHVTT